MSDVKCTGRNCKGDNHAPGCEIYQAAMVAYASRFRGTDKERTAEAAKLRDQRRPDKGHRKKNPDELLSPEQRAAKIRAAPNNGRPFGSRNQFPIHAVRALIMIGSNVKSGLGDDEREVAGFALGEIVAICGGERGAKKSTNALKAAIRIREEYCNPVVSKSEVSASVTMENEVLAASRLAAERRAARMLKGKA